ncbi:multidrug ABC transporter permease [Rhizocola hellebori]|uniref:Multidrug ABC transporter permease n=1 Tax=Rhizocola hellebori TaxID=1392758 RepID=A0A8J3Q9X3_9ACTN|nr:ABC transporter ATP-binding protein [Rhizocola hellebori]GIH06139.1 multidrug ABC transporter permease [Rhizocola hellebori]
MTDGTASRLGPQRIAHHLAAAALLAWRAAPRAIAVYAPLAVGTGLIPVAAAWCTKQIFDRITGEPGWNGLTAPLATLAALAVLQAVTPELRRYLHGHISRAVALRAMDRLYVAVGRLSGLAKLEDPAFRDRLNMAEQAGRGWPAHLVDDSLATAQASITLIGFLATLITLEPALAVVVLAAAVPTMVVQVRLGRARAAMMWRISPHARREHHFADLLTSIPAAKELRLFGLTDMFRGRMLRELSQSNREQAGQQRMELRVTGLLQALTAAIAAAGLVWAVSAAARGALNIGDLALFIAAVPATQSAIQELVQRLGTAHQAALMFDHYRFVEEQPPDLPVPLKPVPVPPLRTGIQLDDVWFRYSSDGPWVLRGVNLFIPAGAAVALVGLNGAGKSSLVKLLCRFYDPDRGSIRWDGIDLRDMPVAQLRDRMAAVFQDYMSYEMTVRENIGVGDLAAAQHPGRIEAAARRAGIHDKVRGLARGYDTLLSRTFFHSGDHDDPDTGILLSGGQWQRLALARAFLREGRDLVILDEPSSGLDAEAEHAIHTQLRAHRQTATSLLISHRLGTIRDADLIVILDDGQVAAQGTHDELMASESGYARLFRLQAAGYENAAAR